MTFKSFPRSSSTKGEPWKKKAHFLEASQCSPRTNGSLSQFPLLFNFTRPIRPPIIVCCSDHEPRLILFTFRVDPSGKRENLSIVTGPRQWPIPSLSHKSFQMYFVVTVGIRYLCFCFWDRNMPCRKPYQSCIVCTGFSGYHPGYHRNIWYAADELRHWHHLRIWASSDDFAY